MTTAPTILVDTSFESVDDLVSELASRGQGSAIRLPHSEPVDQGSWVTFSVNLEDGEHAFEGVGYCIGCVESDEGFYEIELDAFKMEGDNAQILDRILVARESESLDAGAYAAESFEEVGDDSVSADDDSQSPTEQRYSAPEEEAIFNEASETQTTDEAFDDDFDGQPVTYQAPRQSERPSNAALAQAGQPGAVPDEIRTAEGTYRFINQQSPSGWALSRPVFVSPREKPWEWKSTRPFVSSLFQYPGDALPAPNVPPSPQAARQY